MATGYTFYTSGYCCAFSFDITDSTSYSNTGGGVFGTKTHTLTSAGITIAYTRDSTNEKVKAVFTNNSGSSITINVSGTTYTVASGSSSASISMNNNPFFVTH